MWIYGLTFSMVDIYVNPGGLTRVALKKGSLVVNSSLRGEGYPNSPLKDIGKLGGSDLIES